MNIDALGGVTFSSGEIELFGAQNFGIAVIGPNMRIVGELEGELQVHAYVSSLWQT